MSTNDDLYEKVLKAIRKLYGDVSVSQAETASALNGMISEIEIMLDALEQ